MSDYLIHAFRKGADPFQSLSALADREAIERMAGLYIEGSILWERFKDPASYLHRRRQVESWLRQAFIAGGGAPQTPYPIYMVLGKSRWMRTMLDTATRNSTEEVHVPLALLTERDVSFTYPDSMLSYTLGHEQPPEFFLPAYHGKVFTLREICHIIDAQGLPGETWGNNLPSAMPNYIEAQVWNQEVLTAWKDHLPRCTPEAC
jgi:hypothetical protein